MKQRRMPKKDRMWADAIGEEKLAEIAAKADKDMAAGLLEGITEQEARRELLNVRRQLRERDRREQAAERYKDMVTIAIDALSAADKLRGPDDTVSGYEAQDEFAALMGRAYGTLSAIRTGVKAMDGDVDGFDQLVDWKAVEYEYHAVTNHIAERNRHERILARQVKRLGEDIEAVVTRHEDPHLCSRCKRRPRHFDEWCKRCANELGVRPTGKIA